MTLDLRDELFLRRSLSLARQSDDPNTRVGAVIVGKNDEVLSTGFNGLPANIAPTPARLEDRDLKLKLIVHAEMNAVLSAARLGIALQGATLYLASTDGYEAGPESEHMVWGGCPCTRCTAELLQTGITEIVSWPFKAGISKWRDDINFATNLLREAGVRYREVPLPADLVKTLAIAAAS